MKVLGNATITVGDRETQVPIISGEGFTICSANVPAGFLKSGDTASIRFAFDAGVVPISPPDGRA